MRRGGGRAPCHIKRWWPKALRWPSPRAPQWWWPRTLMRAPSTQPSVQLCTWAHGACSAAAHSPPSSPPSSTIHSPWSNCAHGACSAAAHSPPSIRAHGARSGAPGRVEPQVGSHHSWEAEAEGLGACGRVCCAFDASE